MLHDCKKNIRKTFFFSSVNAPLLRTWNPPNSSWLESEDAARFAWPQIISGLLDSKLNLIKNELDKSGIPSGLKEDIKKGFKVSYYSSRLGKSIKEALSSLASTDETIFHSNR